MMAREINDLRWTLAGCSTLDEVLRVCGDAVGRGFDRHALGELLAEAARRHFDRYFIYDQAAASARHRWDAAWPQAGAGRETGQDGRERQDSAAEPPVELREEYGP